MDLSRIVLSLGLSALAGIIGSQLVFAQADPQTGKPQASAFGPRVQKAQRAARRGPPPEIIATYDDWKIQCETLPAQAQKPAEPANADSAEAASGKSDNATASCGSGAVPGQAPLRHDPVGT